MDRFDVDEDFVLDREDTQRRNRRWKLLLSLSLILFYIFVGALIFRLLEGRREVIHNDHITDWGYLNSVYFCTVTLTTIGYGDLYPTYWASKLFNVFFVISGLGLVGYSISTLADLVTDVSSDIANKFVKRRADQGKQWMDRRLSRLSSPTPSHSSTSSATSPPDVVEELSALADDIEGLEARAAPPMWYTPMYNFFWENIAFVVTLGLFLVFEFGGALFFFLVEDMGYGDALYFCIISLATIGYGDMFPKTKWGKGFLVFFSLVGLGILTNFVSLLANIFVKRATNRSKTRGEAIALMEIEEMLATLESEKIGKIRASKKALMVQTELLRLAQVAARRVQYLQKCEM